MVKLLGVIPSVIIDLSRLASARAVSTLASVRLSGARAAVSGRGRLGSRRERWQNDSDPIGGNVEHVHPLRPQPVQSIFDPDRWILVHIG